MAKLIDMDAEVREVRASRAQLDQLRSGGNAAVELIGAACRTFSSRRCLGTPRARAERPAAAVSYGDLWSRVTAAAAGLQHAGLAGAGRFVGIYGSTSIDWIVVDLACLYLGAVSVPLQRTMAVADLEHVASRTELDCIAVNAEGLEVAKTVAAASPSVRGIVLLDGDLAGEGASRGAPRIHSLQAIERSGRARPVPPQLPCESGVFSIVYTSGSTGRPKGVIVTEQRWADTLRDAIRGNPVPTITVGYLPLSHMAGRISVYTTMMTGGYVALLAEDGMAELFDVIRATRPTSMTLVPRVSGMIHQRFLELCMKAGVDPAAGYDHPAVAKVITEIRDDWLGGRLCFAATGAAPTAPDVAAFLSDGLGIRLTDAYGSTEVARIAVDGVVQPGIEYKLVDLPELGYTTRDLPYPRGELAIKSPRQTPGYFRDAAANAALFDHDGFLRTGDIVEERGPRRIVWIDRKNDVVRLAHGEHVNLSRLETLYAMHSVHIQQILLFGDSTRDCLVAVVVPNWETIAHFAARSGESARGSAKSLLRSEIDRIAAANSLHGYEVPRDFVLADEPFSEANGLLSDAGKYRRPMLKALYGERLNALYAEIARRQLAALRPDRDAGSTIEERVLRVVEAVLGRGDLTPSELERSFVSLGGDSLAAARLAEALQSATGLAVSAGALLDGSKSLRRIVFGSPFAAEDVAPTAASIHGAGAHWARARDLQIRKLVPDALLSRAAALALEPEARNYLLTGTSGFLGQMVLAELLAQLDVSNASVTCIARAGNDADACERLRRKLGLADRRLVERFDEWRDAGRLRVLAGDITDPRLGLDRAVYEELVETVDTVWHGGALVNHVLSYTDLFAPNVLGTAHVMRFAVERRRKRLLFVSTSAVAAGIPGVVGESARAERLWSRRPIRVSPDKGYAAGYAASKWAAEILLADLHAVCAVPVGIMRCSMILPHRRYRTVVNGEDAFARLVYGLVKTGVAPESFYAADYRGRRHYDGVPVDLVARAMAALCRCADDGFRIYHVSNSNWDDGVSLDTVVHWIESAGFPLQRLSYRAWHTEFVRRLSGLTPEDRRRSPESIAFRWRDPLGAGADVTLDTEHFRAVLARIGAGEIPSLDELYIHHCVRGICGDAG